MVNCFILLRISHDELPIPAFFLRIPNGTSKELRDLLNGLLKRNAADRLDFDIFFNHPFIRPMTSDTTAPRSRTSPVKVPSVDGRTKKASLEEMSDNTGTPKYPASQPENARIDNQESSDTQQPSSYNAPPITKKPCTTDRKNSTIGTKAATATPRGQQVGNSQAPNKYAVARG